MATRSYLQFRSPSGQRWRNGETTTDAARDAARDIVKRGVQQNVAIALVHTDPSDDERPFEVVQSPSWLDVDLTDDAAGLQFFVKGAF